MVNDDETRNAVTIYNETRNAAEARGDSDADRQAYQAVQDAKDKEDDEILTKK